tara:strand:- start:1140 stop:1466 length:327 start_codon:yes stop_codon:yes gene_type:complete
VTDPNHTIDAPSEGLGDTVAKAISKVTRGKIKSCPSCEERRKLLNKAMPYKGKKPCKSCGQRKPSDDAPTPEPVAKAMAKVAAREKAKAIAKAESDSKYQPHVVGEVE